MKHPTEEFVETCRARIVKRAKSDAVLKSNVELDDVGHKFLSKTTSWIPCDPVVLPTGHVALPFSCPSADPRLQAIVVTRDLDEILSINWAFVTLTQRKNS